MKTSDFIARSSETSQSSVELVLTASTPPECIPESAKNGDFVHIIEAVLCNIQIGFDSDQSTLQMVFQSRWNEPVARCDAERLHAKIQRSCSKLQRRFAETAYLGQNGFNQVKARVKYT
jgi:hypothetical protein